MEAIGRLFPLGGPVPPALVIGRRGEIDELERRLREGLSTMLVGPRRVGKTTVCAAVGAALHSHGFLLVDVEVPERPDARTLLQLIVDRCARLSLEDERRGLLRAARPLLERLLGELGVPLDLSELGNEPGELPSRAILQLPLELARARGGRGLVFFDELQRAVDYADGDQLLADLVDIYGGQSDVVVLVDGSDERALEGMLGEPAHFGKLVDRQILADRMPRETWREPLRERFSAAGLQLPGKHCERLLAWSDGRPYPTMAAARYTALSARKLGSDTIGDFELDMGLDEARRHLDDDGA